MEGGWDRPCDRARTLGERDGNDKPFAEGDDNGDEEYGKDEDCDIPEDDNEYTIGVDGVDEPLDKGNDDCGTLSTAPA
jgi:hypothetical protein